MGGYYYNQGLADALKSFEAKMEDVGETIDLLKKATVEEITRVS